MFCKPDVCKSTNPSKSMSYSVRNPSKAHCGTPVGKLATLAADEKVPEEFWRKKLNCLVGVYSPMQKRSASPSWAMSVHARDDNAIGAGLINRTNGEKTTLVTSVSCKDFCIINVKVYVMERTPELTISRA